MQELLDSDDANVANEGSDFEQADEFITRTFKSKDKRMVPKIDPLKENHACKHLIKIDVGSVNETPTFIEICMCP